MSGIRKVSIEMEHGRPFVTVTLLPFGKSARPVTRRIDLDVRYCDRCAKDGRETVITRVQAERTARETKKWKLCRPCLDAFRAHERHAKRSSVPMDTADVVAEYGRRIAAAEVPAQVDAALLELASDARATAAVIGAVRAAAERRLAEVAGNQQPYVKQDQ